MPGNVASIKIYNAEIQKYIEKYTEIQKSKVVSINLMTKAFNEFCVNTKNVEWFDQ